MMFFVFWTSHVILINAKLFGKEYLEYIKDYIMLQSMKICISYFGHIIYDIYLFLFSLFIINIVIQRYFDS